MADIKELCRKYEQKVIEIRRQIHANPELGGHEQKTTALIADELRKAGIEPKTDYSQYCVTAVISGKYPGKTIMMRADIDALPIQEEVDVPFKSTVPGVMHACGHDMHGASLLGAALVLNELKDELHGNVKFIFQPAEEVKDIGANVAVADGVMENPHVDFVFGTHQDPGIPVGSLGMEAGPTTSYPDQFEFTFYGKKSHGSAPHAGIDAIKAAVAAYHLVNDLNMTIPAMEPHVIQVCNFHAGGKAFNIVADECSFGGTTRLVTKESREKIIRDMRNIGESVCKTYGTTYKFSGFASKTSPVVNDPFYTDCVKKSASAFIEGSFYPLASKLGGEDFCYYLQDGKTPGVFARIGSNADITKPYAPNHNGKMCPSEGALAVATQLYVRVAYDYLTGAYEK